MLELSHLGFTADTGGNPLPILTDINLRFENGGLYVITGPNGGGKSTLARLLMGIQAPTAGTLQLDGRDITGLDITQRAQLGIGYAFQHPPRFKGIRVRDLLELAASDAEQARCDSCLTLNQVGLCAAEYLDRDADATLSGGEMKRVEIASLLSRNLRVAVFDEPEAGIDLWSFAKLAEVFDSIHRRGDTILILISHQERILELADEVIVMAKGRVSRVTTRERILSEIVRTDACACAAACTKGVGYHA